MFVRTLAAGLIIALSLSAWGQSSPAPAAAPSPASAPAAALTDLAVRQSLDKAAAFLYSKQDAQGALPHPAGSELAQAVEPLAAYALLQAGQSSQEQRLLKLLAYVKGQPAELVYVRSLRVLAMAGLGEDYRKIASDDVAWLLREQQKTGGWGYGPQSPLTAQRPEWTDAFNSSLAVIALAEASDAGLAVPMQSWSLAEVYFRGFQNADGGWGNQPALGKTLPQRAQSYGSATAAALIVYHILADKLGIIREPPYEPGKPRLPSDLAYADRIAKGADWLANNYDVREVPGYVWLAQPGQLYHYLFLLERYAALAGCDRIGAAPHAQDVCRLLLSTQAPDGSWNNSPADTALAMLALVQADAPVAFNRLQPGKNLGDPRDAASLARWLSRSLGRPAAWQVFTPQNPKAYNDGPLLYLNAAEADLPAGINADFARFIAGGGMCVVQAPVGYPKYVDSLLQSVRKVLPEYRLRALGEDHPAWNARFAIEAKARPAVMGIGDACRVSIFILQDDLAGALHRGLWNTYPQYFQLMGNLACLAGGGELWPGRLARRQDNPPAQMPRQINLARLQVGADPGLCPAACDRLSRQLSRSLPIALKELAPANPDNPIDPAIRMLWMTGSRAVKLTDQQLKNLRDYLAGGGSLLIDHMPDHLQFAATAQELLSDLAGEKLPPPLPRNAPVLTGEFGGGIGADLTGLKLPGPAGQVQELQLRAWSLNGRPTVFLSPYGLLCAADESPGNDKSPCPGEQARKLLLNLLLFEDIGH
jgi:hypothetical protein